MNTPTSNLYGVNECNPTVYIKDNQYVLSYIAAPTDATINFNAGNRIGMTGTGLKLNALKWT